MCVHFMRSSVLTGLLTFDPFKAGTEVRGGLGGVVRWGVGGDRDVGVR